MAKLKERYANALFELSEKSGRFERDLEQAILVRDVLRAEDVQSFLVHPHIPNSAKHQLFHRAFSEDLSKYLMGFLYLAVRKNRESLIVPVLTEYIQKINKYLGRIEAKVVSAKGLTEKQIQSIKTALSRKTGMQIDLKTKIDSDVIGGFYILIDGYIFDGTIRSKLNTLKESLKRGVF